MSDRPGGRWRKYCSSLCCPSDIHCRVKEKTALEIGVPEGLAGTVLVLSTVFDYELIEELRGETD